MRVEVKVPQLPESVAEATLVNWHKKVGGRIARDENLVDVETDKVVLELPAPVSGVLVEILKGDGTTVAGQEIIAVIDSEASAATTVEGAPEAATVPVASTPAAPASSANAASAARPATALPAARKMMSDQGVAPASVEGTGRGGRITKGDVIAATRAPTSEPLALAAIPQRHRLHGGQCAHAIEPAVERAAIRHFGKLRRPAQRRLNRRVELEQ